MDAPKKVEKEQCAAAHQATLHTIDLSMNPAYHTLEQFEDDRIVGNMINEPSRNGPAIWAIPCCGGRSAAILIRMDVGCIRLNWSDEKRVDITGLISIRLREQGLNLLNCITRERYAVIRWDMYRQHVTVGDLTQRNITGEPGLLIMVN